MANRPRRVVQGGAIIVKHLALTPRVLIVRSSDSSSWLFPKGHVESGETRRQAAEREAREEAGVVADGARFVGIQRYQRGSRTVEVSYYCFDYVGDTDADEDREIRWCTPAEARKRLSFPELVRLLDRALA